MLKKKKKRPPLHFGWTSKASAQNFQPVGWYFQVLYTAKQRCLWSLLVPSLHMLYKELSRLFWANGQGLLFLSVYCTCFRWNELMKHGRAIQPATWLEINSVPHHLLGNELCSHCHRWHAYEHAYTPCPGQHVKCQFRSEETIQDSNMFRCPIVSPCIYRFMLFVAIWSR